MEHVLEKQVTLLYREKNSTTFWRSLWSFSWKRDLKIVSWKVSYVLLHKSFSLRSIFVLFFFYSWKSITFTGIFSIRFAKNTIESWLSGAIDSALLSRWKKKKKNLVSDLAPWLSGVIDSAEPYLSSVIDTAGTAGVELWPWGGR